MKTLKLITALSICILFLCSSCTANISRHGYVIDDYKKKVNKCDNIIVVKRLKYEPKLVDVLGVISASDTGFSTECSESFVMNTFKQDACMIGADIINIVIDSKPDRRSTCYRSEAEFLRVKDREMLIKVANGTQSADQSVDDRSKRTKCLDEVIIGGTIGGIAGMLLLYGLCRMSDTDNNQNTNPEPAKVSD